MRQQHTIPPAWPPPRKSQRKRPQAADNSASHPWWSCMCLFRTSRTGSNVPPCSGVKCNHDKASSENNSRRLDRAMCQRQYQPEYNDSNHADDVQEIWQGKPNSAPLVGNLDFPDDSPAECRKLKRQQNTSQCDKVRSLHRSDCIGRPNSDISTGRIAAHAL